MGRKKGPIGEGAEIYTVKNAILINRTFNDLNQTNVI